MERCSKCHHLSLTLHSNIKRQKFLLASFDRQGAWDLPQFKWQILGHTASELNQCSNPCLPTWNSITFSQPLHKSRRVAQSYTLKQVFIHHLREESSLTSLWKTPVCFSWECPGNAGNSLRVWCLDLEVTGPHFPPQSEETPRSFSGCLYGSFS